MTWEGQKHITEEIASEATRLICEAYERNPPIFGNRSKKLILGGLFYLLGQKYGQPRTQKQIAHILDTNDIKSETLVKTGIRTSQRTGKNLTRAVVASQVVVLNFSLAEGMPCLVFRYLGMISTTLRR